MHSPIEAIGLAPYLSLGAILLVLGVFGIFLNRKNVIIILMSIELILLSANINFVAFSAATGDLSGQVMTLFVLTIAAAESAIGLAIVTVYFRNRGSIAVDDITMRKGEGTCRRHPSCLKWRCSRPLSAFWSPVAWATLWVMARRAWLP